MSNDETKPPLTPAATLPESTEIPTVEVLPNNTTERVTFSEAQQLVFNRELKAAQARAGGEARAEASRLRAELQKVKAIKIGSAEDASTVERLRAQVADAQLQAEAANQRAIAQHKQIVQQQLAQQIDAISPSDVSKLLSDNLRWDEAAKTFTVVDDSGNPRLAADGTQMLAESLYSEFQNSHPWAIRGQVKSGGGGTSGSNVAPQDNYSVERLWGAGASKDAGRILNEWALRDPRSYALARKNASAKGLV